jgi:hypothetical protein
MSSTHAVSITGANPLLLHHDNIPWAGVMQQWGTDPANKGKSVAGDDRTPAHRWIGCLYHEAGRLIIPSDNLMTMLREGGARCPTGKRGATFKRQTQSGLMIDQSGWTLTVNGNEIPFDPFKKLIDEPDFAKHEAAAVKHGFSLFVKRARVGQAKHVRVRPRFDKWEASGTITILDDTITGAVLADILTYGGRFAGLGDWRPSSPKSPGPFGTFTATVKQVS